MKLTTRFIFILLLLGWHASACAQDKKVLVFATANSATEVINAYFHFLQRVYDEFGYTIELKRYPIKRQYVQADVDKIDGILISTESLLKKYQNLVVVPVKLSQIELTVFSINQGFAVDGPTSLKNYRIGILRGYILSDTITRGMKRQIVDDYKSLFTILKMGRVDVVIALRKETARFLAADPTFGPVKTLQPPLDIIPMYHFLNKRHAALVPEVSHVMERLIDENVLEEFYRPYVIE